MKNSLCLSRLPAALRGPAAELLSMRGESVSDAGTPVLARRGRDFRIRFDGECFRVTYRRKNEFFRALTMLERARAEKEITVPGGFDMLCYMADASRNAVFSVAGAKRMIRLLASMGYDSMMLYTEDTYTIPGYPYFGRMRGRYSEDELKELDRYAESFGIELIPCIQTLAHLGTAIRWPGLRDFSDTGSILMAGDERTYAFVRDALNTFARCLRSRRVNIGMDEAHELGLGRYLIKNGYRRAPDIMTEHLSRVAEVCRECGFSPMMWSDMFFRMAFGGAYRVGRGQEVPREIIEKVPKDVALVYWDYYQLDRGMFDHMVECHQKFDNEILFAGGAWKWSGFAPHNRFSLESSKIQLDSCAEHGLRNIIVTGWGDDGGEASQFSTLPVLLYFAERLYAGQDIPDVPRGELNRRAAELFGRSFDELLMFDLPNALPGTAPGEIGHPVNPAKYLFYNDVLEGLFDRHVGPEAPGFYAGASKRLLAMAGLPDKGPDLSFSYIYRTLGALCGFLEIKSDLGVRLTEAYRAGDRDAMRNIAVRDIPAASAMLDDFYISLRDQWREENKPFGFSEQELRIGGLGMRLASAAERILEYLDGGEGSIDELDEPRLRVDGRTDDACPYILHHPWNSIVRAGV